MTRIQIQWDWGKQVGDDFYLMIRGIKIKRKLCFYTPVLYFIAMRVNNGEEVVLVRYVAELKQRCWQRMVYL